MVVVVVVVVCVCGCVCVCARTRARVCVCVCVCVHSQNTKLDAVSRVYTPEKQAPRPAQAVCAVQTPRR
jgi:hypothetical protein